MEQGAQATSRPQAIWRGIVAHRYPVLLALLVLASLVFRVHVSRECSYWLDEGDTINFAHLPLPALLRGADPVHPPFSYWMVRIGIDLFGEGETALRAASIGFGSLLLVLTYWLCLELELSPPRALVVVASLAITPHFLRQTTEARQYAILGASTTLAALCVFRLLKNPRSFRDLVGAALGCAMASGTQYFGLGYALGFVGVIGVCTVPAWIHARLPARRWAAILPVFAALFAVLGVLLRMALALHHRYAPRHPAPFRVNFTLLDEYLRKFSAVFEPPWPYVTETVLAAIGLVLLGRRKQGMARVLPAGLAFGPPFVALFISSGHFVAARYLTPSFIFYHLGACVALLAVYDLVVRGVRRVPSLARFGAALGALVFLVPLGFRLAEFPLGYRLGHDDYRGLQRYFREHLAADTVIVGYVGPYAQRMVRLYPVGRPPVKLEDFEPVPGIHRYLVAEYHVSGPRHARFEALLDQNMGISKSRWRALPLLDLPHSAFQPAVPARLVVLDDDELQDLEEAKAEQPTRRPGRTPRARPKPHRPKVDEPEDTPPED